MASDTGGPGYARTLSDVRRAVHRAAALAADPGHIFWGRGFTGSAATRKLARTLYTWLTGIAPDPGLDDDEGGEFPLPDPPLSIETAAPVVPAEVAGLVRRAMLTGRHAFGGTDLDAVCHELLRKPPTPIRFWNPDCPANLDTLIRNLAEKRREDRYPDVPAVRAALATCRSGAELPRTRRVS